MVSKRTADILKPQSISTMQVVLCKATEGCPIVSAPTVAMQPQTCCSKGLLAGSRHSGIDRAAAAACIAHGGGPTWLRRWPHLPPEVGLLRLLLLEVARRQWAAISVLVAPPAPTAAVEAATKPTAAAAQLEALASPPPLEPARAPPRALLFVNAASLQYITAQQ